MTDPLDVIASPSPDAIESRVGDETVILHLGNGTYYGLDPIGTEIWEGVKAKRRLTDIRDAIVEKYGVAHEVVEADMRKFLSDLLANDILRKN